MRFIAGVRWLFCYSRQSLAEELHDLVVGRTHEILEPLLTVQSRSHAPPSIRPGRKLRLKLVVRNHDTQSQTALHTLTLRSGKKTVLLPTRTLQVPARVRTNSSVMVVSHPYP